jgi:transposase-like protein
MNQVSVRPYSMGELANQYCISTKTLRKWIKCHEKAVGPRIGKYFTTLQIHIIYERLGTPE